MDNTVEQLVNEYTIIRPKFEAFISALDSLIRNLVRSKEIDFVTLESRAKTIESFRGKIQRDDKSYVDPLQEITDLAGIRIITYQLADIDSVCDLIRSNFEIDEANSVDKLKNLAPDRFGYLSVHFVVTLNAARINLPEYSAFAKMKAEIQIRSVLQHSWAAIDHKLRYKRPEEIPLHLRRKLYRISALLETADSEFESLRTELAETRQRYQEGVSKDELNIELNVDSLAAYATTADTPRRLIENSSAAGCVIMPHNSRRPEFSLLLSMLEVLTIQTLDQFDDLMKKVAPDYPEIIAQIKETWQQSVDMPGLRLVLPRESVLRFAVLFSQPPESAKRIAQDLCFGDRLRDALQNVYRQRSSCPDFELPFK